MNFVAESAFVRPSNKVPFLNKILNREKGKKREKRKRKIKVSLKSSFSFVNNILEEQSQESRTHSCNIFFVFVLF